MRVDSDRYRVLISDTYHCVLTDQIASDFVPEGFLEDTWQINLRISTFYQARVRCAWSSFGNFCLTNVLNLYVVSIHVWHCMDANAYQYEAY